MTDPSLFSDGPKKYHPALTDLFEAVFRKHPEARRFDPCPCGVAMCVIRREWVQPWHYPIEDIELRDRVRAAIIERGLGFTRDESPDAVLVLSEIA